MKRSLLIIFCLASLGSSAQVEDSPIKKPFKERLFTGGNVILQFSNFGFIVGATPTLGYRATEKLDVGVSGTVLYSRFGLQGLRFDSFVYGGSVYSRYQLFEQIFLQTEFQVVNTNAYDLFDNREIGRRTVPQWYVGGGARQPLGGNAFAMVFIMYDLIDDPYSPFQNPFYGGGIVFGLR